ncbi:hypothetical protein BANRA_00006 [Escherichia coli]|nr:hypothetical protein BANRA_00006 [Escherichia coli]
MCCTSGFSQKLNISTKWQIELFHPALAYLYAHPVYPSTSKAYLQLPLFVLLMCSGQRAAVSAISSRCAIHAANTRRTLHIKWIWLNSEIFVNCEYVLSRPFVERQEVRKSASRISRENLSYPARLRTHPREHDHCTITSPASRSGFMAASKAI